MPFAVAAGVAAVGTIAGAAIQADAANSASKRAVNAQRDAQAQARGDLMPWMTSGENALGPQQALLGINGPEASAEAMANFQASPGYQFTFDEAMRGVTANASAAGLLGSGATAKALQDRGANLANQEFGTYWNRLNALSQQGLQAGGAAAGQSIQTGQGVAQTQMSNGTAQASIYGNAAQGLGNAGQQYFQNSAYQNALAPQGGMNAESTGFSMWGGGGAKTF